MKYLHYNLLGIRSAAVLILAAAFFMSAGVVMAADLSVTPESDPLISLSNLIPGASVSKTLTIANNGTEAQDVYIAVANENDGGLADGLRLFVSDGSTTYFNDLFSAFFASAGTPLGVLASGDTREYELTVSMPGNTPSTFQGTSLDFDLLIGFEGTGDTVVISGSGGGGGGGGSTRTRTTDQFGMGGSNVEDVLPGPTPQILGEQVSVIPVGAPNTGAGSTRTSFPEPSLLLTLSLLCAGLVLCIGRARRAN